MYTVYVVDDEMVFLKSLVSRPEWLENQFEIIGFSTNPKTAEAEILNRKPDIVFTDVRMPHVSGLDLVEHFRTQSHAPLFVVISAYSDFSYLKRSIQLSVFDYLLKPVSDQEFVLLLTRLFLEMKKRQPQKENMSYNETFEKILQYIDEHLSEKCSLTEVADAIGVSANTVGGYFNKYLATTFTAYLTEKRMDKACRYLRTTGLQVKEVAAKCGYEDYFYFCRVFQKTYDCTPSAMRKQENDGNA